jgi:hypothetical protein
MTFATLVILVTLVTHCACGGPAGAFIYAQFFVQDLDFDSGCHI